jgi:hypothetical protein
MLEAGWPVDEMVFGFLHPFWSLWLFSLISLVPFPIVKLVWEATLVVLCGLSVGLLVQPSVRSLLHIRAPRSFLVFSALLFPPTMSTLYYGQVSAFTLLGIAGWLALSLRNNYTAAGALLSLTAIKPQLFIPFYLWVFFSHFKRKEHTFAAGFIAGLLLQAGISLVIAPHSATLWVESMQHVSLSAVQLPTPSLTRLLSEITGLELMRVVVIAGAGLTAILTAMYSRGDVLRRAILVYLPLSLLAAPYTWTHGFLALLPAQFALLSRLHARQPRVVQYGVFAFAALSIFELCMPNPLSQYMLLLPLLLFFFGIYQMRMIGAATSE